MEFIKIRDNKYLIKNSNGKIVDEKEKNEIEKGILSVKSASCKDCNTEYHKKSTATSKKLNKNKKAINIEVVKDEINEETDSVI